jgi:hypothetical protein
LQAAKAGPNHDTLALVTAVPKSTISIATWANHDYNYMQFRTSSGGVEVGSISLDAQASIRLTSYWPYGAGQGNAFHVGGFPGSSFQTDPSGSFLVMSEGNGTSDYVFGTANGIFAMDNPNGTILCVRKAAAKDFDPIFAGTYKAILLPENRGANRPGKGSDGTTGLSNATMVISADAQITVTDTSGTMLVQASLTPVADAAYLYGSNELQDPCFGLVTFRVTTATSRRDVFVSFMDRAILFFFLKVNLPWVAGNTYDYLYRVGLKCRA